MEFESPFSITVNITPVVTELNSRDVRINQIFRCPKFLIDFCDFCLFVLVISTFAILPILEVFIGIIYRNECFINHYIPIYLIVAGIISIINLIVAMFGVKHPAYKLIKHFCVFSFISGSFCGHQ
jgi:hypothetical protein